MSAGVPLGGRAPASARRTPALSAFRGSERTLRVEERAERAARQDAPLEALAALPEGAELEGGAPGHLLRVVGGDELISLVHLARPPVPDALEQAAESAVDGVLACKQKRNPVTAALALAALARPAFSQADRFAEAS